MLYRCSFIYSVERCNVIIQIEVRLCLFDGVGIFFLLVFGKLADVIVCAYWRVTGPEDTSFIFEYVWDRGNVLSKEIAGIVDPPFWLSPAWTWLQCPTECLHVVHEIEVELPLYFPADRDWRAVFHLDKCLHSTKQHLLCDEVCLVWFVGVSNTVMR